TLESELQSLIGTAFGLPASVGAGATWAAGITGLAASDITYLAAAVSGGQATAGPPTFDPALAAAYLNPSIDGYRGPSKHTDGTYAWRAIRTLQVICGRFQIDAAKIFDPAQASGTFARGGIERPGGLIVNGWGANDAGVIGTYSIAGTLSGAGGNSATSPAVPGAALGPLPRHTYPYASNKWNSVHDTVTIDRWDYDKGRTKSGAGTQGMDQNLVPGMRASLGLHPYKVGQLAKVRRSEAEVGDVILPYGFRQTAYIACDAAPVDLGGPGPYRISVGPQAALANMVGGSATIYQDSDVQVAAGTVVAANTVTGEIDLSVDPTAGLTGGVTAIGDHLVVDLLDASIPDKDFEVEVLSLFKNGPGNTRPNIKLDQELFLSKWGEDEKTDRQGEYRINFIYSTDAFMGDATRFADIILPDTSYLERFDNKDWENMGLKGWWGMRQPVMRQNMAKDIWADDAKDLYLYEARPVNSIQQELSNAVAGNLTTAGTGFGLTYDGGGGHPIYNANLGDEDYDPGVAGVEGQAWDTIRLGGIGAHKANYYEKLAGSGVPSLSIAATASDTSWAFARVFGNMHDANQVIDEYTGFDSVFGGHGGWAKQNAPRTWLDDDLCAVGNVEADWADTGLPGALRGYTALEIFNKRETQILEPGMDAAVLPPFTSSVGYKFRGLPTFQGSAQQVSGGYPRHLTTYKLNVHTQSRTAQNALLTEIIGACWAVIGATGTDATGLTATDDNGATIRSGDRVKVQTKQGFVKLEAKVTDKAQAGVVSISNSFGHEKKGQDSDTIGTSQGVSTVYGSSN
ncbi:MAG: hypothetical protein ACE5E0_04900, partial [Terriglobia bacterium]